MNDLDERKVLARELRSRSEDVAGAGVGFDAVRRSARRIQWRRRIAGGVAAAAVLAVAVPTALAVQHDLTRSHEPVVQPGPDRTQTDHATPLPDGSYPLRLAGLPTGASPLVGYVHGNTLNSAGGTSVEMPRPFAQVVPFGDGWLARDTNTANHTAVYLDRRGGQETRDGVGYGFALSREGSVGYVVVGRNGAYTLVHHPRDGEERTWNFTKGTEVRPVGYLAPDAVVYQRDDPTGGRPPTVGVASVSGPDRDLTGLERVSAVSESAGLVAGVTSFDSSTGRSCVGVVEPATGQARLWQSCDHYLADFSPDGQYVAAMGTLDSPEGQPTVSVLDARTGEPVVEYRQSGDSRVLVTQVAWEDDGHLLTVAHDGLTWRILRLDTGGHIETATDPAVATDPIEEPFHLLVQP